MLGHWEWMTNGAKGSEYWSCPGRGQLEKLAFSPLAFIPSGLLGQWKYIAIRGYHDMLVQPEQKISHCWFHAVQVQRIWVHTHAQSLSLVIGSGVTNFFPYTHFRRVWQKLIRSTLHWATPLNDMLILYLWLGRIMVWSWYKKYRKHCNNKPWHLVRSLFVFFFCWGYD